MRTVFSSNETSEVVLVRDALERKGIDVTVQNENSSLSPVPGFRPMAEIWIERDDDYEYAKSIVTETQATLNSRAELPPWVCSHCHEESPSTFEICWKCGADRPQDNDQA